LREAASAWFEERHFAVSSRYPYILAEWVKWPQNIILPSVADYIRAEAAHRQSERRGFPLHKYLHHGLSSQAMLFNLVGPLIVDGDLVPLQEALAQQGIACPKGAPRAELECEDRTVFNEDTGQPTSIDLLLQDEQGAPWLFLEAKLVERGFGGCSVFAAGDCDGRNPARDFSLCYLHHLGRTYWELLDRHGFLSGPVRHDATCILSTHYQFFREIAFALEKGGAFILLFDARNPTFYSDGALGQRGLMPFLLSLLPVSARARVAAVSIQQLVAAIRASGRHGWVDEFERKYGLQ
jgi:hypothetical protein